VLKAFFALCLVFGTFVWAAGSTQAADHGPNYLGVTTLTDTFCSYQAPFSNKSACVTTTGTWFHDDTSTTLWQRGPQCSVSTYNGFSASLAQHYWEYVAEPYGQTDILFNCTYSQSLLGKTTCVDAAFIGNAQGGVYAYYNGTHGPLCN